MGGRGGAGVGRNRAVSSRQGSGVELSPVHSFLALLDPGVPALRSGSS